MTAVPQTTALTVRCIALQNGVKCSHIVAAPMRIWIVIAILSDKIKVWLRLFVRCFRPERNSQKTDKTVIRTTNLWSQ